MSAAYDPVALSFRVEAPVLLLCTISNGARIAERVRYSNTWRAFYARRGVGLA